MQRPRLCAKSGALSSGLGLPASTPDVTTLADKVLISAHECARGAAFFLETYLAGRYVLATTPAFLSASTPCDPVISAVVFPDLSAPPAPIARAIDAMLSMSGISAMRSASYSPMHNHPPTSCPGSFNGCTTDLLYAIFRIFHLSGPGLRSVGELVHKQRHLLSSQLEDSNSRPAYAQ